MVQLYNVVVVHAKERFGIQNELFLPIYFFPPLQLLRNCFFFSSHYIFTRRLYLLYTYLSIFTVCPFVRKHLRRRLSVKTAK